MKQQIEIYLHGAGTTEERLIGVPEDATVGDLVEIAKGLGYSEPDIEIFLEDGEDPLLRKDRLRDCGIGHKHHLHCHRCRKVEVTVEFNGKSESKSFAPGRKVKGVLKWALHAHHLHGVDAENKELRLGNAGGTILHSEQHIGSFVHSPHCRLQLYLTAIVEVQG